MTERLVQKWRKLKKLVAAVGGLMILIGVVLLGVAILASLGFVNVGLVLERKYVPAFVLLMVLAGLFDTFAAVLIARW